MVAVGILLTVAFFLAMSSYCLREFSRSRLSEICKSRRRENRFSDILKHHETVLLAVEFVYLFVIVAALFLVTTGLRQGNDFVATDNGGALNHYLLLLGQWLLLGVGAVALLVILPRTIARVIGESFLFRVWPTLVIGMSAMRPVVSLLNRFDALVHRMVGRELPDSGDAAIITDEIRSVIDEGQREGVIESEARTMIHRVIELQEEDTAAIMTPRTDMVCIRVEATLETAREQLLEAGHSRIPVIGDTTDDIIGILYAKDLLRHLHANNGQSATLRELVREPYYVPETTGIDTLLQSMKHKHVHLAIVIDEYGGVAGLVSMEDILEEIVGEIVDEYDAAEETGISPISPDVVDVESRVHIDDLNEQFNFQLPEDGDYDTIGGFVFHELGRVPTVNESLNWKNLRITIQSADQRSIHKLRIETDRSLETAVTEDH